MLNFYSKIKIQSCFPLTPHGHEPKSFREIEEKMLGTLFTQSPVFVWGKDYVVQLLRGGLGNIFILEN